MVALRSLWHRLTDALRQVGESIGYGVRLSLRGRGFGTEVLRQTMHKARTLGQLEILLTCANENAHAASIILRNGGQLLSQHWDQARGETVQRYLNR